MTPQQTRLRARRAVRFDHIVKRFDLVAFSEIADWLAHEPGSIDRNGRRRAQALDDLRSALGHGEVGAPRKTFSGQVDLFNALNQNAIFARNSSIGASLGQVQQILQGRIMRLAFQMRF